KEQPDTGAAQNKFALLELSM
ncbi:hypothetical protein H632_c5129p0, partial [Helicosporidium sp. ATCC 50920]